MMSGMQAGALRRLWSAIIEAVDGVKGGVLSEIVDEDFCITITDVSKVSELMLFWDVYCYTQIGLYIGWETSMYDTRCTGGAVTLVEA